MLRSKHEKDTTRIVKSQKVSTLIHRMRTVTRRTMFRWAKLKISKISLKSHKKRIRGTKIFYARACGTGARARKESRGQSQLPPSCHQCGSALLEMASGCRYDKDFKVGEVEGATHRWILTRLRALAAGVEEDLRDEVCLFHEATSKLYHFLWGVFCDEYLEMIKPALAGKGREREEARVVSAWVFYGVVRLLHPFVPFVTERIFQECKVFESCRGRLLMTETALRGDDITSEKWDADVEEVAWVLELINEFRSLRSDLGLPPQKIVFWWGEEGDETRDTLERWSSVLRAMAGVERRPLERGRAVRFVYQGMHEPKLLLPDEVDLKAMRIKIKKKKENWSKAEKDSGRKILRDKKFKKNAPPDIFRAEKEKWSDAQNNVSRFTKIQEDIENLLEKP